MLHASIRTHILAMVTQSTISCNNSAYSWRFFLFLLLFFGFISSIPFDSISLFSLLIFSSRFAFVCRFNIFLCFDALYRDSFRCWLVVDVVRNGRKKNSKETENEHDWKSKRNDLSESNVSLKQTRNQERNEINGKNGKTTKRHRHVAHSSVASRKSLKFVVFQFTFFSHF